MMLWIIMLGTPCPAAADEHLPPCSCPHWICSISCSYGPLGPCFYFFNVSFCLLSTTSVFCRIPETTRTWNITSLIIPIHQDFLVHLARPTSISTWPSSIGEFFSKLTVLDSIQRLTLSSRPCRTDEGTNSPSLTLTLLLDLVWRWY